MQHKFRLLLTAGIVGMLMTACGSETNDSAEVDGNSINTDQVLVMEDSTDETETETSSVSEETDQEETGTEDTVAEEADATEDAEESEIAEVPAETEEVEETEANIQPIEQTAIDQLVKETKMELENYAFLFDTTEEFVEIEVREQTDAEATPLVGIYRYMIDTEELLVNDYLTGEFIPYEANE